MFELTSMYFWKIFKCFKGFGKIFDKNDKSWSKGSDCFQVTRQGMWGPQCSNTKGKGIRCVCGIISSAPSCGASASKEQKSILDRIHLYKPHFNLNVPYPYPNGTGSSIL